jgi:hypothetical protein
MLFVGDATTPEDRLFRAGWDAVPALLEAAKDSSLEPRRRAWAFAMLWNVLGREDPSLYGHSMGWTRWVDQWPTSAEPSDPWRASGTHTRKQIDPASQETLAQAWRGHEPLISIRIVP